MISYTISFEVPIDTKIRSIGGLELCKLNYRYSTDSKKSWSEWLDFESYINYHFSSDYWLEVLCKEQNPHFGEILFEDYQKRPYSLGLYNEPVWSNKIEVGSIEQPDFGCALQLQEYLSDSIINLVGQDVEYFKVEPQEDSKVMIFREWSLHNITNKKTIRILLEEGNLPSSNYNITPLDWDWEGDFRVYISKSDFSAKFGPESIPHHRDIIWIPFMQRLYEVNSALDERKEGLMWQQPSWCLTLVKYQDSDTISKDGFVDSVLDSLADVPDCLEEEFNINNFSEKEDILINELQIKERPIFNGLDIIDYKVLEGQGRREYNINLPKESFEVDIRFQLNNLEENLFEIGFGGLFLKLKDSVLEFQDLKQELNLKDTTYLVRVSYKDMKYSLLVWNQRSSKPLQFSKPEDFYFFKKDIIKLNKRGELLLDTNKKSYIEVGPGIEFISGIRINKEPTLDNGVLLQHSQSLFEDIL